MKHMMNNSHYIIMFFIMIIAGALSTMNVWVNKITDIRISINDVYMIFLMTGWMFFFMGIIYQHLYVFIFGLLLVIINIYLIRTQTFVTENQYKLGMIPHHSMAILMSKKLLKKQNNIQNFLKNLIYTQESEINFLKNKSS
jgi:hypothetical protein